MSPRGRWGEWDERKNMNRDERREKKKKLNQMSPSQSVETCMKSLEGWRHLWWCFFTQKAVQSFISNCEPRWFVYFLFLALSPAHPAPAMQKTTLADGYYDMSSPKKTFRGISFQLIHPTTSRFMYVARDAAYLPLNLMLLETRCSVNSRGMGMNDLIGLGIIRWKE